MKTKRQTRQRRTRAPRAHIKKLRAVRLCIHRTPNHIYAQLISADGAHVVAAASTLEKEIRADLKHGGNKEAAVIIGRTIGQRGVGAGVKAIAFDRSGFKYHGRVKALADAAREAGLEF